MPQFSLKFAAIAMAYSAVLCFAYVTPNLWAGWLVVIATAALIANSILHAFRNQNQMALGFAIVSSMTLITCLGFAIETRGATSTKKGNDLRVSIYELMRFAPAPEPKPKNYNPNLNEIRVMHHIYYSVALGGKFSAETINLSRLAICIVSLLIGSFGGLTFKLLNIPRQKKFEPEENNG